jgi:hypothetical protein
MPMGPITAWAEAEQDGARPGHVPAGPDGLARPCRADVVAGYDLGMECIRSCGARSSFGPPSAWSYGWASQRTAWCWKWATEREPWLQPFARGWRRREDDR